MKIDLTEIYAGLKAYRHGRGLTAQNQKDGYIINIMKEMGELAQALRDFEKIKNGEKVIKKHIANEWNENKSSYSYFSGKNISLADAARVFIKHKEVTLADVEYEIIGDLCAIAVLTINAGADIPCVKKDLETHTGQLKASFAMLIEACAIFAQDKEYSTVDYIAEVKAFEHHIFFNDILHICACLAYDYGFNFEVGMIETIKEISSHTGSYDEVAKKWAKDESDEAKSRWYKADYEKARIEKGKTNEKNISNTFNN